MTTYLEFKEMFLKVLGKQSNSLENSTIVIELVKSRYNNANEGKIQLEVTDDELQGLYEKVNNMKFDDLELYSDNYYEVAVNYDCPLTRKGEESTTIDDVHNGIQYELSLVSLEYSIYLLMKLNEEYKQRNIERLYLPRFRRTLNFFRYMDIDEEEITLEKVLPRIIDEVSLKIRSNDSYSQSNFKKLMTSFSFNFMYLSNISLIEYKDIGEIFRLNTSVRTRFDINQINNPPLREYIVDVIDYYKLALSSNDSYIKYISFYHIMEYYYDEIFKKKLVKDLKSKITHPNFSYKDDDKVYDIALFIKNRIKINVQDGQGKELKSLNFVLKEFIDIEELKKRIDELDNNAILYYKTEKVPFCNAPIIPWNDMQGVYTKLSQRIYYTRNSLIHSKSGKNSKRYHPYKNENQLQKEIPLVMAVAELIIINSSKII